MVRRDGSEKPWISYCDWSEEVNKSTENISRNNLATTEIRKILRVGCKCTDLYLCSLLGDIGGR